MIQAIALLTNQVQIAQKLHQCHEEFRENEKRIETEARAAEIRLGIQDLTDEEQRLWRRKIAPLRADQVLMLCICIDASGFDLADFLEDMAKPEPSLLAFLLNDMSQQIRPEISNN